MNFVDDNHVKKSHEAFFRVHISVVYTIESLFLLSPES